ncbi:hypothetical protein BKI52_03360 [marine bacterium AO1-C]|nr:hypothetical protein BKI52_03360 [marine bacterium AO1-C]
MKDLMIHQTSYTPLIAFNTTHNVFTIAGSSYSEHTVEFYKPVLIWLNKYLTINQKPIIFHFQLSYFNTSSLRMFTEIMQVLERFPKEHKVPVYVNWFTSIDNKEMIQDGEDLKEDFPTLEFQLFLEEETLSAIE